MSLKLKFEEFNHTVVFEGTHSFRETLNLLKNTGYLEKNISQIKVHVLAYQKENYSQYIELSNPILDVSMVEFANSLPQDGVVTLLLE